MGADPGREKYPSGLGRESGSAKGGKRQNQNPSDSCGKALGRQHRKRAPHSSAGWKPRCWLEAAGRRSCRLAGQLLGGGCQTRPSASPAGKSMVSARTEPSRPAVCGQDLWAGSRSARRARWRQIHGRQSRHPVGRRRRQRRGPGPSKTEGYPSVSEG